MYYVWISTLAPTSTINNISTSYTWNSAETCVFVYFKSNTLSSYVLAAQYTKVTAGVTAVTPTLTFGKNGAITSSITKYYSGSATPNNYNGTAMALSYYEFGSVYNQARINAIDIKGLQGQAVHTISLSLPYYPSSIT